MRAHSASITADASDVTCVVAPTTPDESTAGSDGTAPSGATVVSWTTAPCAGQGTTANAVDGGSAFAVTGDPADQRMLVAGSFAKVIDGLAAAPADAPLAVQEAIWQANDIIGLPYIYGGGHQSFTSRGYDCSGTVSYALHGGSLLRSPLDSTQFERWGGRGVGTWITIFANGGHAYMDIAGLRLDTSSADDPSNQQGPRWRPLRLGNAGYVVRHPRGL